MMIHASVLYMNLRKKLRLLLRFFFSWFQNAIQGLPEGTTFHLPENGVCAVYTTYLTNEEPFSAQAAPVRYLFRNPP